MELTREMIEAMTKSEVPPWEGCKAYEYCIGRTQRVTEKLLLFVSSLLEGSDDYTFSKVVARAELEKIMRG